MHAQRAHFFGKFVKRATERLFIAIALRASLGAAGRIIVARNIVARNIVARNIVARNIVFRFALLFG